MSSGVLGYHEMYITEIAECIRKIYVKQNEKKWVAWVQNGDIYFSPHTQEVLVVYNAVNPQPYKKVRSGPTEPIHKLLFCSLCFVLRFISFAFLKVFRNEFVCNFLTLPLYEEYFGNVYRKYMP